MIGNDVIDLAQSRLESRWQRKGFTEKIFTPSEQQLIACHKNPEILIWLLWSMKEAAYKIYNRQTKIREFSPKKLECSLDILDTDFACGTVICNENKYYTKTELSTESIHTIAVHLVDDINNTIEVENKGIIKDENGIPYLKVSSNIFKDVSISHHGSFERVVMLNS